MKCSNPACEHEEFKVTVQHKSIDRDHPDRLPVKLVCAKCRKPVKVWITNEQMKEMLRTQNRLVKSFSALVSSFDSYVEWSTKPWWKFW